MKKIIKNILLLLITVSIIAGCSVKNNTKSFKEGTYIGVGTGRNGEIKLEVTFNEKGITNIEIVEHKETEGIADPAFEKLPKKIIETQTLEVDSISGATLTSNGIIQAVKDAVSQSGGNLNKTTRHVENNNIEEIETDIVVVGAGAAGISAALSAISNNVNVFLLEKTSSPMGAGTLAGGMFAADSSLQKESGKVVDKEWLYNQYMHASNGFMNSILVRKIIDESGKTVDWLIENGMELNLVDAGSGFAYNHVGMPATLHGYNEGGSVALTKLAKKFEELGGNIRWSTPAYELIVENDTIKGVLAKKDDGSTLKIKAKAVIIATGGYGGNAEMLKEYIGENYTFGEILHNTGDGINMAFAAGADELGIGVTQYFWEIFKQEEIGKLAKSLGDDWFKLTDWTMFPMLRVNSLGQRFSNEDDVTLFAEHGAQIAMQPNQLEYVVIDSSVLNKVKEHGTYIIEDHFEKWIGNEQFYMEFNLPNSTDHEYKIQHTPYDYVSLFDSVLDSGVVFKGNTLEELATNIGIDKDNFIESVNQYNNAIYEGVDKMFFADTKRLVEIKEGPYYAIKFVARNLGTLGGIRINENMQVLNKNHEIIKGLYAAGADAGGMYGKAYVDFEGGTLGFAYTSGRLAGEHSSKNIEN